MTATNDHFNRLSGVWANRLNGQWLDEYGWFFLSQPSPDMPDPLFTMRFDQMHETITFKKMDERIQNVGIRGALGFWQAMGYEVSIKTPEGEDIHHEVGHFMLEVTENGETQEPFHGNIIRQFSTPRAIGLTSGVFQLGKIDDHTQDKHFYSPKPEADNAALQDEIETKFQQAIIDKPPVGLDLDQPLNWLQNILPGVAVGDVWVFGFQNDQAPTQVASGQRVEKPVAMDNLLSNFWIGQRYLDIEERRRLGNLPQSYIYIETLQYAQKVNLRFLDTEWPHVAINSLIKQE